jgi:hypothetical protein
MSNITVQISKEFIHLLRLIGQSGLDDQQCFQLVMRLPDTHCIFRAQHNRHIKV